MTSNLSEIFNFIIEMDKLKAVLRKTKPTGFDRYENSAEHSWQVCLLAQLLVDQSKLTVNISRVTEILLVHDIPEIDVGDQIVYQGHSDIRAARELEAAQRIFGLLPDQQAKWCMERWQEYEDHQTNESIFAYAIDRLMPLLHNLNNDGQSWKENNVPLNKVLTFNAPIGDACPEVWDYLKKLLVQASESGLFNKA
ncbi:MAG: HD family hydrolase [Methylophilaceae bacterium]|nr:HD domain-containing protein [Methyloradius sp.]